MFTFALNLFYKYIVQFTTIVLTDIPFHFKLRAPKWRNNFKKVDLASFFLLYLVQTETLVRFDKDIAFEFLICLKVFQQLTLSATGQFPAWLSLLEVAHSALQVKLLQKLHT